MPHFDRPFKRPSFQSATPRARKGIVRLPTESVGPLRAGHPLVYKEAIQRTTTHAELGEIVELLDSDGNFIGRGIYDTEGGISVRMFTRKRAEMLDAAFFLKRIQSARALRDQFLLPTVSPLSAYRVVHGEGDFLPGITVDRYGNYLLLHLFTNSLNSFLPMIYDALETTWNPDGIYLQKRTRPQTGEGPREPSELVRGRPAPIELEIEEGSFKMGVDVTAPLGTGLFLDFRNGRQVIGAHCAGKSVLNLFSYTGSISLHAAAGGATRVTSVDLSAKAHARARQNFQKSGIDPELHEFIAGDVFAVLTRLKAQGRVFDVVVVDPPPFSQSNGKTFTVHKDYGELIGHALEVCATPGWLFCGTNAMKFSMPELEIAVAKAGIYARKTVQVVQQIGLPVDFPISPAFPEGHYLKWVGCAVR